MPFAPASYRSVVALCSREQMERAGIRVLLDAGAVKGCSIPHADDALDCPVTAQEG